jgi:WD40 repeat protein
VSGAVFPSRLGCVASLRRDVYWVTDAKSEDVTANNATDGDVLANIDLHEPVAGVAITADGKFLLVPGLGANVPLYSVNTHTNMQVDTSERYATAVSVCDDGTIISASLAAGARLVTYDIAATGHLQELSVVNAGRIRTTVCSPGSAFIVASMSQGGEIRSLAISTPLTSSIVDSVSLPSQAVLMVFNPTTTDLFVLLLIGKLSVYTFDSNTGMFGALQASVDTGDVYTSIRGFSILQFAYDKLFVLANDQLLAYDASLNLLSNETIISEGKGAICISEGVLF